MLDGILSVIQTFRPQTWSLSAIISILDGKKADLHIHYSIQSGIWSVIQIVQAAGLEPLSHYLDFGWKEGRSPHPLFDPKWYLERNPDVQAAGVEPLSHYLESGWKEGRDPNPFFNTRWYLESNPAAASLGLDPLQHYCRYGWQQGLSPSSEFESGWYLKNYQKVAEAGLEPLGEYLSHGSVAGRFPNPDAALISELFDEHFYRKTILLLPVRSGTPFQHYCTIGWREGRDPNPFFSTRWYFDTNPDLGVLGINPLETLLPVRLAARSLSKSAF